MSPLKEYLNYYKTLSAPGYAVLVRGAWGVGKTYQVKKALKNDKTYYISLFGLENRAQIESAVLTAANPALRKKKIGLGWSAEKAKAVGGLYSLIGIVPSAINSLLKIELDPESIIIFDDLERCSLKMKTLLGVINWFVEHQGSKVVVLAHDKKLGKKIRNQKEKVFGHTILVEPDVVTAFHVFLQRIKNSNFMPPEKTEAAAKFLVENRKLIFAIFEKQVFRDEQENVHVYEGNSLRVLERSLFDVARFYSTIDPKFLINEDATSKLITEFCVFNLEHKMGSLPTESLLDNWSDEIRLKWERRINLGADDNTPLSPLEQLERKYSQIQIDNLLLDQVILSQTVVQGIFDANLINKRLSSSAYFAEAAELPAWRRFMSFDELDDDIVEQAKNELINQFESRELDDVGSMLHMFGLIFMMSENNIISDDIQTVEQSCIAYIDDLLSEDKLPPRPTDGQWPESLRSHVNYGFSYWVTDTYRENFRSVSEHLNEARTQAFQNQGDDITKEIITALLQDSEAFTKLISYRLGEGKYAAVPVMTSINPEELADLWLSTPKTEWRNIQYAFNSRYEGGRLQDDENHVGELSEERDWAIQLRLALEARATKLGGYKGLRINRIIPNLPRAN